MMDHLIPAYLTLAAFLTCLLVCIFDSDKW